jgi:hypothetical protein
MRDIRLLANSQPGGDGAKIGLRRENEVEEGGMEMDRDGTFQ